MKLAAIATHPIFYHVPWYRRLADHGVVTHAFFVSDMGLQKQLDREFKVDVEWDVPLLGGYEAHFLNNEGAGFASPRKRGPGFNDFQCSSIGAALRQHGPFDVVLIQGYGFRYFWQATWAANALNIPVVIRAETTDDAVARGWLKGWLRRWLLRRLYRRLAGFIAIGTRSKAHFLAHGIPDSHIAIAPYGVESERFEAQAAHWLPQRKAIRDQMGIAHDALGIMFVGKLFAKKAPLVLADALLQVADHPRLAVIVAGDGEQRAEFEARLRPRLGPRLVMLGFVNQTHLGRVYAAGDVLVLPSAFGETWGLVVNEAMIFGRPAIVSDKVGCGPDLVLEGQTGFRFPAGDASVLAAHLRRLLNDPTLAPQLGERAAAHVNLLCSTPVVTRRIADAIRHFIP